LKTPIGISIEFGINSHGCPSLLIYRQKWGRLRAKVPEGIEHWHTSDVLTTATYLGLKLDLHFGTWKRPVMKPWAKSNPWTDGKHWFVMFIPAMIGAFFSFFVKFGNKEPGFYIGTKSYRVDDISAPQRVDGAWAKESDRGNVYLCPSFTIRGDLVD